MSVLFEPIGVICLCAALLVRSPDAVIDRAQRVLHATAWLIALNTTLYQHAVVHALQRLAGRSDVVELGRNLTHTLALGSMVYLVLGTAARRRHTGLLVIVALAVSAATAVIIIRGPELGHIGIARSDLPVTYWAGRYTFYVIVDAVVAAACLRNGRLARLRLARWSLWLFGLSRLCECVLLVTLVTLRGWNLPVPTTAVRLCVGLELVLLALSLALPKVGGLWHVLNGRRVLRQLAPLWGDLARAVPDVVLAPPTLTPWSVPAVNWHVHRVVVEIRDAWLHLRAYTSPATVAAAHAFVAAELGPAAGSDAAAVACWSELARRAKLSGAVPRHAVVDPAGPECTTLIEETAFILQVAQFRADGFSARFAAHHPPTGHCAVPPSPSAT